ncbi:hypothetical protein NKJ74_06645 [Mesorhizobium sp. M0046]|uniref:hypothetical protein n=1 Tax=Mesorhizobium sp. M0046 TaxID=2956858 RepID=UPI00333A6F2F
MTVHHFSFRRAPGFPGLSALPICSPILSAHGRIENRDIGNAAILDQQEHIVFGRENTLARPYGAGDAADRERGLGAPCGGGDMVKVHCHRNSSLAANFPRRINNLGHFRFRFRQRGQQELVLFLLSLRREGSPIRRLSRG